MNKNFKNILIFSGAFLCLLAGTLTADARNASRKPHHSAPQKSNTYMLEPARVTNGSVTGVAYSLRGRDHGINLNYQLAPASTMKVLTATAALLQLGPNYVFKTELLADSRAYRQAGASGVLKSDIAIRFSGAPDLTSDKLLAFLRTNLKDRGINRIQGRIYLDVSSSVGYDRGNGWTWDDLPLCFSAPASAAVIDHNCVYTNVVLRRGQRAFNQPPLNEFQPIKLQMETPLLADTEYSRDACSLKVEPSISNVYRVTGCFSSKINHNKDYQLNFKFAVQNPNLWSADIIAKMMKKLGISYTGRIEVYRGRVPLDPVAVLPSKSLRAMLDHMLKRSDNLYAEEICKATARSFYGHPVSISQAATGMREILSRKAGINFRGAAIHDCSGLSSYNIVSPQVVLNVLKYALAQERHLGLLGLLPISGQSGTMRSRRSVVEYPLSGNVVAKTGTIKNVRNLAGYVKSEKGNFIPFVIYSTGFSPDKDEVVYMNSNKTLWPNFEFEKRVLTYLYEEKDPVIAK